MMELILGTAQFNYEYGLTGGIAPRDEPRAVLAWADLNGVSILDTSPSYGSAEQTVGDSNWSGRVHTKVKGHSGLEQSLTDSLRKLRRQRVDTVYFHDPCVASLNPELIDRFHSWAVPRYAERLGVSVYTASDFEAALIRDNVKVIQFPVNPFDRRISDELIAEAKLAGKILVARSVFLQGLLQSDLSAIGPFFKAFGGPLGELQEIAHCNSLSLTSLVIGWLKSRPGLDAATIGFDTVMQLREVVACWADDVAGDAVSAVTRLPIPAELPVDPRYWLN